MKNQHSQSTASLLGIYAALITLLLATVFANHLQLGPFSLVVALLIAAAKAILVILVFMHVRLASRVTWIFVGCGFIWLAILFTLTFSDYLTRSWSSRAQDITPRISHVPSPPGLAPEPPDPAPPAPFRPSPYQR